VARKRQARKCKGHRRDGEPCGNYAMTGGLVCTMHGGKSPQALAAAERRVTEEKAQALAARFVIPVRTTAREALTEELGRVTALVAWLDERCAELRDRGELAWGQVSRTVQGDAQGGARRTTIVLAASQHPFAAWYERERVHLSRLAVEMARIGIEERHALVAEQQAAFLKQILDAVFTDPRLRMSPDQMRVLPSVVSEQVRALAKAADV
jgi:hypothetical protein